ncbi:MAG: DUF503 domain-containing protein [Aquificaceae bacterium]
MIVGVLKVEFFFPENGSLKEKRYYLRSLKDRLKNLNVSVAEIDHQDLWQRSKLAVVCASVDFSSAQDMISKTKNFIEKAYSEFITDIDIEYLKV